MRQQLDHDNDESKSEERDAKITDSVAKPSDPPRNRDKDERHDDQKKHSLSIGTKRNWKLPRVCHFVVGNPAAFQALKPPAMERTFL